MGTVPDPTAVERPRRNTRRPGWFTTDMVIAYALPVIEEAIPSTVREAEISSEAKMWKAAMNGEMQSLYKNDTWDSLSCSKGRRPLDASGCMPRSKDLSKKMQCAIRLGWWLKATLRGKELTITRYSLL